MQKKKLVWWFCGSCLSLASLPGLWIVGGNWMASEQEQRSQQQWQMFTARFADSSSNQAALKLEATSASLGINLLGLRSDRPSPDPARVKQVDAIHQDFQKFLERQLEDSTDAVEPLPPHLKHYLQTHAQQLNTIRQQELQGEMPQWDLAMPAPDATQVRPTFVGFVRLQRLLVIDALEKNRLGQTEAAIADLEASWRLNQALRDRPELSSQVVALVVAKTQAGTLRKIKQLPPIWQQRLMEHDYRQSFLVALNWESWLVADLIRKTNVLVQPQPLAWSQRFLYSLRQPYLRLAALDATHKMRQAYQSLPQQNSCRFDAHTFDMDLYSSLAVWNNEREATLFGFAQQWRTAGFLMVDLELTQKVLKTKAAIANPSTKLLYTAHRPSRVCPEAQWIYRVSPEAEWSLSFSQVLERPPRKGRGLVLPLTYRAKAQKL